MAKEKKIPFTKDGLKTIASIREAVGIFQNEGIRTAQIVNAYQEAHELNLYNTSFNMATIKDLTPSEASIAVTTTIQELRRGKESQVQTDRIKKAVYKWYGVTLKLQKQPAEEVR